MTIEPAAKSCIALFFLEKSIVKNEMIPKITLTTILRYADGMDIFIKVFLFLTRIPDNFCPTVHNVLVKNGSYTNNINSIIPIRNFIICELVSWNKYETAIIIIKIKTPSINVAKYLLNNGGY